MTISYVGEGAFTLETGDASPLTYTYPTVAAGEKLLMPMVTGNDTAGTPSTPSGWSAGSSFSGGGGTWGFGTGPRRATCFEKDGLGSESGTFDITWVSTGGNALAGAQIHRFSKTAAAWAATAFASGEDTSVGGGAGAFSVTTGALDLAPGDMVLVFMAGCSDSVLSNTTISASGITFGTLTEREIGNISAGNASCHVIATALVSAGSGSVAVTVTCDVAGDGISGVAMVARLREAASGAPKQSGHLRRLMAA